MAFKWLIPHSCWLCDIEHERPPDTWWKMEFWYDGLDTYGYKSEQPEGPRYFGTPRGLVSEDQLNQEELAMVYRGEYVSVRL